MISYLMKVAIAIIDFLDLGSGKCRESSIGNRQEIQEKNQEENQEKNQEKESKGEGHSLAPGH